MIASQARPTRPIESGGVWVGQEGTLAWLVKLLGFYKGMVQHTVVGHIETDREHGQGTSGGRA